MNVHVEPSDAGIDHPFTRDDMVREPLLHVKAKEQEKKRT
ncbi:hypothetical protein VDGD_20954 [Verticillium dahliae]|nr:hypothetical protein VDGD_20954 [Verticillium dahliae]